MAEELRGSQKIDIDIEQLPARQDLADWLGWDAHEKPPALDENGLVPETKLRKMLISGKDRLFGTKTAEKIKVSAKALRDSVGKRRADLSAEVQRLGLDRVFSKFRNVPKSMAQGAMLSALMVALLSYYGPADVSFYMKAYSALPVIFGSTVGAAVGQVVGNLMEKKNKYARMAAMIVTGGIAGLATATSVVEIFHQWHVSNPSPEVLDPRIFTRPETIPTAGKEGILPSLPDSAPILVDQPVPSGADSFKTEAALASSGLEVAQLSNPVITGNGSVASNLLADLGKIGLPDKMNLKSVVDVVVQVIDQEQLRGLLLGEKLANVAWTAIPDGTVLNFKDLFSNVDYLNELRDMINEGPYGDLREKIAASKMSVDEFIQKLASAYGAKGV